VFIAHAPVGWLTARALGGGRPLGVACVAGALAPDLDLLLWLRDPTVHHHAWPTHWPLCWLALVLAAFAARSRLAAAFAGSGLLHCALDTIVGDIRWLAPFSDRAWSLFVVERAVEPWWLNFLLHPTFALELALVAITLGTIGSRRGASRAPSGRPGAGPGAPPAPR
jgi:hypothetical protein